MNKRLRAIITALYRNHSVSLLEVCEVLEKYEYGLRIPLSQPADPLVYTIPAHKHNPYQPFSCWQHTGFVSANNLLHQVRVRYLELGNQDTSFETLFGELGRKNVSLAGAALVSRLTALAARTESEESRFLPVEEGSVLCCPDLYIRSSERVHALHRSSSEPFVYCAYFSRGKWWWHSSLPHYPVPSQKSVSVIEIVSSSRD
jgi:hypothetical protein